MQPALVTTQTVGVSLSGSYATAAPPEEGDDDFMLLAADGSTFFRLRGNAVLGRHASCNVVVDDERVSSIHCGFTRSATSADRHVILDDRSSNGTFLNGRRVGNRRKVRLVTGDEIGIVMVKKGKADSPSEFVQRYLFHDFKRGVVTQPPITDRGIRLPRIRHWQLGNEIGRGAHGTVSVGINSDTGELIAVKIVPKSSSPSNTPVTSAANERALLSELKHSKIVQYLGFEETDSEYRMFLEYISGGSIQQLLENFGSFDEAVVRLYALQILEGLEYLHSKDVVHGDIKPGNILVTDRGQIKLSDFGTSRVIGVNQDMASMAGTPRWMSPDMIQTNTSTKASDIWALGCVVLEMASGRPPWSEIDFDNAFAMLFHIGNAAGGPSLEGISDASPRLQHFVASCLIRDPSLRPSATDLAKHPFISSPFFDDSQTQSLQLQRSRSSAGDHLVFIEKQQRNFAGRQAIQASHHTSSGLTTDLGAMALEAPFRPQPRPDATL